MKNFIQIIMLCAIVMPVTGCTESKVNGYREQYIDACAEGDFAEAHKILDKMEPLFDRNSTFHAEGSFRDHQEYVYNAEISALASSGTKDDVNRIVFLMKQDDYCGMSENKVFDLAINMNNEYLCERMVDAGADITIDKAKGAVQNDMSDLLDKMLASKPKIIADNTIFGYVKTNNNEERLIELIKAGAATGDEDVLETAKANGYEKLAKELVLEQLNQKLKELQKEELSVRPALGLVKSNGAPKDCVYYQDDIHSYNEKCKSLMIQAAELGYKQIANKAFNLIRPNIEWKELGSWRVVDHGYNGTSYNAYRVTENRNEINDARNTLKRYR
jgi:hypothetical protein